MMKRIGICLCLLAASALTDAQVPSLEILAETQASPGEIRAEVRKNPSGDVQVMTLKNCMDYAVSNSTKVRIQQAAVGDAQIARRDAVFAAFTPKVSGGSYAYYNFGRTVDPQTNIYINTTSFHNGYQLQAGIDLFNGFEAVNNLRITKTALAMGQTQEKQVEADICLATMEAYYNLVYYTRLADIYATQVETVRQMVHKARRQEELGQKGHADVVQMEAELADKEYEHTKTVNLRDRAELQLKDVMFWPTGDLLAIDTEVPEQETLEEPVTRTEMVEYARAHMPSAQIARWTLENAKREWNGAKWQLLPSLGLYGGWSTTYFSYPGGKATDPFRTQFKNNGGEYIQLSLNIPIFNRFQRHSAVARKRNAYRKASAEYDQKIRDIEAEVAQAVQDREGASAAFRLAQKKSDVQEEAYFLNSKKLEQGLISPIEYQTATNAFLTAKADHLNALFQYLIKRSVVRYLGGTPYNEQ